MLHVQEVMKGLAELETQLDDLDGRGQLLIIECVETDGEVVQHRINELRYCNMDEVNHIYLFSIVTLGTPKFFVSYM